MKIFKKILEVIADIFVVLVFFASITIIIVNASFKKDLGYSNLFGNTFFVVETHSMEPTIKQGDLIVCKILEKNEEISVDDIVSFRDYDATLGGEIIKTHRIIKNDEGKFYTKGDNEVNTDTNYKLRSEFVAKYSFRIPLLGSLLNFLKEPIGFIFCIIIPILLVIGVQVYKIVLLFMDQKRKEIVADAKEATSDEVKNAIIQEYLAKQKQQEEENKKE